MWKFISNAFQDTPGQMSVARKMTELGLRVSPDGRVLSGDVEVTDVSLAAACGVDRRIVRAAVLTIQQNEELSRVFGQNMPAGSLLVGAAHEFGFGVVELSSSARTPGVIAAATALIAAKKINVRQIYGEDPDLYEAPRLIIVTEKPVPGSLIADFAKIKGVTKVSIL